MKKRNLLFVLLIFVSSLSFGQKFYEAEIIYNTNNPNGNSEKGYAKLPDASKKKVKFKKDLKGSITEINSDDILYLQLKASNGKTYVLERNNLRMIGVKKDGSIREKIFKRKAWTLMDDSNTAMNYYIIGQNFRIKKDGSFIASGTAPKGMPSISFGFRRPNENNITIISDNVHGAQGHFRKIAAAYFGDNTNISKKIKNKEFKKHQVYSIYSEYIK